MGGEKKKKKNLVVLSQSCGLFLYALLELLQLVFLFVASLPAGKL